jgi:hypothetical protein
LLNSPVTIARLRDEIKNLRASTWLGIFGLAALFIALRWNNFNAPLDRDEGDYAYAGQLLIHGVTPYEHEFIQKPPLIIYTYAFSNLLLPQFFWSARLLASVFVTLTTILLGCIARWEFGRGVALPTMWLMTLMVLAPEIAQFSASVEMFMLLPLLAMLAVYCRNRQKKHPWHWFAAAFFGVTAVLYKYTAFPVVAFTFLAWLAEMMRRSSMTWRPIIFAFAGGTAAVAIEIGYFLMRDGGAQLWECTVKFNRFYVQSGPFGFTGLMLNAKFFWQNWWLLFLIPWAAWLLHDRRIWFWLGIFICAIFSTGLSAYGQYYIILMPFWALLTAVGIRALSSRVFLSSKFVGGLLTVLAVLFLLRPDVPWLLCREERFAQVKMGAYPFIEARAAAERVSSSSSPDDFVFIAGSEPEILFYAQRFNPTRFSNVYPLMIPSTAARCYQLEAIQDLQKRSPKLIVFVNARDSWVRHPQTPEDFFDFMKNFLAENYALAGGYVKIDWQKGYWSDQLDASEQAKASLLIYRRKF